MATTLRDEIVKPRANPEVAEELTAIPNAMIVEDKEDVLTFLKNHFPDYYRNHPLEDLYGVALANQLNEFNYALEYFTIYFVDGIYLIARSVSPGRKRLLDDIAPEGYKSIVNYDNNGQMSPTLMYTTSVSNSVYLPGNPIITPAPSTQVKNMLQPIVTIDTELLQKTMVWLHGNELVTLPTLTDPVYIESVSNRGEWLSASLVSKLPIGYLIEIQKHSSIDIDDSINFLEWVRYSDGVYRVDGEVGNQNDVLLSFRTSAFSITTDFTVKL